MADQEAFIPIVAENSGLIAALKAEGLPTEDLGRPGNLFWCLRQEAGAVGYIGLEPHGQAALLRSLVILPPQKGRGYGKALVRAVLEQTQARGISELWLLTNTASAFFQGLGWEVTDRRLAPEAIVMSGEFTKLCPASATCMRLRP